MVMSHDTPRSDPSPRQILILLLCCRGNGASVARIVPYAAVHFGSYEWYRQALVDRLSTQASGSAAPVSPVWDLLAGSAAGGTAVLLTYPLDLVRL